MRLAKAVKKFLRPDISPTSARRPSRIISANCFAGVGGVADSVVVAHPVHHLGDAAEWSGGAFPGFARLDVGEGEKREGGAFVLLLTRNADHLEKLKCLADSCG
jgi:hypothetical protein